MVNFTRTVSPLFAPVIGRAGSSTAVYSCDTANPRFTASTVAAGVV